MTRRLVAILPCRCNSTRLWGKPLQRIAPDLTICEYIVRTLQTVQCVDEVRLAIARGPGEDALIGLAKCIGLGYSVGPEDDVLGRVIACAQEAGASDVLRRSSEDPFMHLTILEAAWLRHVSRKNDITAVDLLPEGTAFEILTVDALARCYERGDAEAREHVANYARFHQYEFVVDILLPEPGCQRVDLRLTVDNPEDLIVCRAVCEELGSDEPLPLLAIIEFLDQRPDLTSLVSRFVTPQPVWLDVPQSEHDA